MTAALVDLLLEIQGLPPEQAQRRLPAGMQLVWEVEPYDGSRHYDLLVRHAGGTLSLAYVADGGLPWPLRGVHRSDEKELVRVDGTVLHVQDAMALLDVIWQQPVMQRLIDVCLVHAELAREPIPVDDDELQAAVDALRRRHGLFTREATARWMGERGLDEDGLAELAADSLREARLRRRIAAGRVEDVFAAEQARFARVSVARLVCRDEERAADLAGLGFYAAAEAEFLAGGEGATFVSLPREVLPGVEAGQLVRRGRELLRVLAVVPARLDDATREAIEARLFTDWLAERRAAATIVWNWGAAR